MSEAVEHPADALVDRYASDKTMTLGNLREAIRGCIDGAIDAGHLARTAAEAERDALLVRAEAAEYELARWKEIDAKRPDWENLWEEQSERADALLVLLEEAARVLTEIDRDPNLFGHISSQRRAVIQDLRDRLNEDKPNG
jgi:hypothetical protein